jgi:riboflavin-specific deaminase-like protein
VVANMVATVDGKAAVEGKAGPIGGEADRELFHRLRTAVDAVLVGSGTLRVERYGRLVRDAGLRAAREAAGLAPDPLACVVTRSLDLPVDLGLLQAPEQEVAVFTSAPGGLEGAGARVTVERLDPGELTFTTVLRRLRRERGVRSVLCEGGPTVLGVLLHEGALDEVFLTVSPRLAGGGEAPTIVTGAPLPDLVELELAAALEANGELFLRYRVGGSR